MYETQSNLKFSISDAVATSLLYINNKLSGFIDDKFI